MPATFFQKQLFSHSAPSMAEVRTVFERRFACEVIPQLETGISGHFQGGLTFVLDETFYDAVATGASKSEICYEGSLRALLLHLGDLRTQIKQLMAKHEVEFSEDDRQVSISGDGAGGIILTHTSNGTYIGTIKPFDWLGREGNLNRFVLVFYNTDINYNLISYPPVTVSIIHQLF